MSLALTGSLPPWYPAFVSLRRRSGSCGRPGENAWVIEVGDGLAACFKMESHNHPSFIEPFRGATAGVGEIMRDVFTMGARPIANQLPFGRQDDGATHDNRPYAAPTNLEEAAEGLAEACRALETPIVSGKVSLQNEMEGRPISPRPTLGIVGIVEDLDRVCAAGFSNLGEEMFLLGSLDGMSLEGRELAALDDAPSVIADARTLGTPAEIIREIGGDAVHAEGVGSVALGEMIDRWANCLEQTLRQDG